MYNSRGMEQNVDFCFYNVIGDNLADRIKVNSAVSGSNIVLSSLFKDSADKENYSFSELRSSYDWHDKTILIAEDEETNFMYLKVALSKTQARILRAKNGIEAVEAVKSGNNIDLILMDVKMPEMNGVEATRIIKSINKDMIVIAQTAYAMEEDQYIYMNAGCNDYLAKPIALDRLFLTVSKYLK